MTAPDESQRSQRCKRPATSKGHDTKFVQPLNDTDLADTEGNSHFKRPDLPEKQLCHLFAYDSLLLFPKSCQFQNTFRAFQLS